MSQVATDLRNTVEAARRIRFEPTPIITATNVQDAITQLYSVIGRMTGHPVAGQLYTYSDTDTNRLTIRSNGGVIMVDTLPFPAVAVDTLLTIYNADNAMLGIIVAPGALLDGTTLPMYVGAKQSVSIYSDGANYFSIGRQTLARAGLALNDFYVNPATGNNTTHTGLAPGEAFASPEYAYNFLKNNVFANGKNIRLNLGTASYTDNFTMTGPIPGIGTPSAFIIRGSGATPADVLLRPNGGGSGATMEKGAMAQFQNVQFRSLSNDGLAVADGGTFAEILNVDFSTTSKAHIYTATGGRVNVIGDYKISASAENHIYSVGGGFFDAEGAHTYTLTGVPAFIDFVRVGYQGFVDHKSGIFVGDATGRQFVIEDLGVLHTQTGRNPAYFSMPSLTPGAMGSLAVWD